MLTWFQPLSGNDGRADKDGSRLTDWNDLFQPLSGNDGRADSARDTLDRYHANVSTPLRK